MKGKTNRENMDLLYCYCIIVILKAARREKSEKKRVFIWEALFDMKEEVQETLRPEKFNIIYKIWEYMPLYICNLEYIEDFWIPIVNWGLAASCSDSLIVHIILA